MKPHRIRMTHNLLLAYGLLDRMDVLSTPRSSDREMTRFHSDEYINFLKLVSPDTPTDTAPTNLQRFNVLEDCPVFDGLWEYCQIAAGGSLAGAARLNDGVSSVAINWAGGLHHAKKAEASGFCYINDCVLAILELLKVHPRVLYVDIDIHHGDGVEEAFYTTDRVMTVSFHKFGDYFPGTGAVGDLGIGKGKFYSANFPLKDGIDDPSYKHMFEPVMTRIMAWYRPGAVVLQCGADSLSGDRLGCFNLTLEGHAQCVDFFKTYDVPLLLLGGGGYTIRNVARCWAYETSRVVGVTLSDDLPYNENYEFYGPEFRLHILPSNMENHNTTQDLENTTMQILENLRHLPHAPSTYMHETPRRFVEEEPEDNPDIRVRNQRAIHNVDYAGSDEEDDDQYISSLRRAKRKAKRLNFPRRRYLSAGNGGAGEVNGVQGMRVVTLGSNTAVVRENGGIGSIGREHRANEDRGRMMQDDIWDRKDSNQGDGGDRRDESGRGRRRMEPYSAAVPIEEEKTAETDEREGLEGRAENGQIAKDASSEKSDATARRRANVMPNPPAVVGGTGGVTAVEASEAVDAKTVAPNVAPNVMLECSEQRATGEADERDQSSDAQVNAKQH